MIQQQLTMPKHFIFTLLMFTCLNGFFLFQEMDWLKLEQQYDSVQQEYMDATFESMNATAALNTTMTIINMVCVVLNILLITVSIHYVFPGIDFSEYWRKMIKKKWIR